MPRVLPRFSGGLDVAARAFFQAGRARFISAKAMSRPWPRFIARSIHSIAQGSKSRALCSGPAPTRPEAEIGEERRDRRALGGIVAGEEHHRLLRVAAAVLHIAEAGGVERLEHRRALGPGGDLLPRRSSCVPPPAHALRPGRQRVGGIEEELAREVPGRLQRRLGRIPGRRQQDRLRRPRRLSSAPGM
jgi:hypothetical protein